MRNKIMNRKTFFALTIALVMFVGITNSPITIQGQTTAKIGLLTPLTGGLGTLGPTFQAGAELAITDLNNQQTTYNFQLFVQDTQTDSTLAHLAANMLVGAGVFGVVGAAASSVTLGANPTFAAANIPQISYASTSPALTTAVDSDYLFRVVPSDAFQGKAGAQLIDELAISNVAVIGIDDPYGQGLVNAFVTEFEALGGTVSLNLAYDQVMTFDFSSQVTQIINASVEAVYMVAFLTDGAAILNELYTQNFNGTILGTDGIASNGIYSQPGFNAAAAEGVMGTAPTISGTAEFITAFEAANPGNFPGIFVAEAYDATMLLGLAAIEAGSLVGSDVRDVLRTVDDTYAGATGNISFDVNGDRDGGRYDIWQFLNDTLTVTGLWEYNVVSVPPQEPGLATVKIGLLTPLTGGLSTLGPTFQAGAELAIKDLNNQQTTYNFQLVVQDTHTDSTNAQDAATALVAAGVSGVVGAAASSVTLGSNPTFAAAKIPQISYASTSPALTTATDSDFLFRVVASDAFQGKASAQLAFKLGLSKVAVIGIDDPYGQGLVNAFVDAHQALGGTVALNLAYDQVTTVDFSSQVTQIVDADVEAVYMVAFLTDGAAILNELKTQKFKGTILGNDGIASNGIYQEEGFDAAAAEGVMGTAPTITGSASFVTAYKADNADASPGIFVAEAYDATMLLGLAAIAAGSTVGIDVRDQLRNVDDTYEGASGTISFDANGDRHGGRYDIWQFWNGKLTIIGDWEDNTLNVTPLEILIIDEDITTITTTTGLDEDETPTVKLNPFNFIAFFFTVIFAVRLKKYFKMRL